MSKLAGSVEAAQAVPGIEAVDINDGWIIDHTQQIDTGNGTMKYVIMLPGDPTPFECTPFQVDQRRDMIKMWMGAVRQAIVERAGAAEAATREAALKAKRERDMGSGGIKIADSMPSQEELAALSKAIKPRPADPAIADAIMREIKKPPETSFADAKRKLATAKAEVAYWRALVKALDPAV